MGVSVVADALVFRRGYYREATGRGRKRNDRNAWRIERRRLRRAGGGVLLRLRSFFSFSFSSAFCPRTGRRFGRTGLATI